MPRPQPLIVVLGLLAGLSAPARGQQLVLPAVEPTPGHYPPGVVDVTPPSMPAPNPATVPVSCPEPRPSFLVSVDFLLVRPRRLDLDYAIVDPLDDRMPVGAVANLEWQTRTGVRTSFGWRPGGGANDLTVTYTYVYSNDRQDFSAPNGGLLYPTLTRPGVIDNVRTATAFSSLNYNVLDFDLGRTVIDDDAYCLRLFAGSRLAAVHQVLEAGYDGIDANQAFASHRVNMDGGGLTLGGETHWKFGRGLSAFARGRGSLVAGDYRVGVQETDFAGNMLNADVNDKFMKVVPVLDMALGLRWQGRHVFGGVGYELSHWFNQVEGFTFLDDFAEGKRVRKQSDLSLEAITFQLGVAF